MGIKDGTLEYILKKPLDYKFEGRTETAGMVLLREPGMEHIKYYLRLKQMLTRTQFEIAEKAGDIAKTRDTIGEVVKPLSEDVSSLENEADDMFEVFSLALQMSEKTDIGQFIGVFEKMITTRAKRAICMVDNRVAMTTALWGNFHPDDAFEIAVRWCVFFGMPSEEGERTTFDQQSVSRTGLTEV